MNRSRTLLPLLCLIALLVVPASAQAAQASGDFNGDGSSDLAVGAPNENLGGHSGAGAVNVLYGEGGGDLRSFRGQLWHQDRAAVEETAETGDRFGNALAAGDFNGDGRADLAVGVPHESVGSVADAGAVNVLYGSAGTGLSAAGDQLWHQDRSGVEDTAEEGDQFGRSVTTGDFNGDGFADLAVGVPEEGFGSVVRAGVVNVLYGSPAGLTATGDQLWHQDRAAVEDTAEDRDRFGSHLAAGDLNGDGRDDLAVGVPLEDLGDIDAAGAVNVLYGSAETGLSAAGDQLWHQDRAAVEETAEAEDFFGGSLAIGDLNGDGRDDLAVGSSGEDVSGRDGAGAVNVLYGTAENGLTATGDQLWHQDRAAVEDTAEAFDGFGNALAIGDLNGDGRGDLVAGVPFEDVNGVGEAGAVNVLYGSPESGLTATGDQFWHQDRAAVEETAEADDEFGSSLATGDFSGDGKADLAVGAPGESVGAVANAGAASVFYGTAGTGLTAAGDQIWHQDRAGVDDTAESGDGFGTALASGAPRAP